MVAEGVGEGLRQFNYEVLPGRVNQIANDPYARG